MLNQVILVGKVSQSVCLESRENEEYVSMVLSVGDEEIPVTLSKALSMQVIDFVRVGTTIGVKARLKCVKGSIEVCAEKLTFINTKEKGD